jgi:hypothetical protein
VLRTLIQLYTTQWAAAAQTVAVALGVQQQLVRRKSLAVLRRTTAAVAAVPQANLVVLAPLLSMAAMVSRV